MSVFDRFSKNGTAEAAQPSVEGVEKATHVALGTPAAVRDAVNETVERWRKADQREKDLKVLRGRVEKGLARAEKRGVEVRTKLPGQVERGLQSVERRGEKARKQLVEQAKATRKRVEPTLKRVTNQARERTNKTQERARELV